MAAHLLNALNSGVKAAIPRLIAARSSRRLRANAAHASSARGTDGERNPAAQSAGHREVLEAAHRRADELEGCEAVVVPHGPRAQAAAQLAILKARCRHRHHHQLGSARHPCNHGPGQLLVRH
eukprot:4242539-Prymnesium_polylepis.1